MPKKVKRPKRRNKLRVQIVEIFGSYDVCESNTGINKSTISRIVNGHRDPTAYQAKIFKEFGIDKFE